jgi:tetratricopeptide (TPR) repeat protein
MKPDKKDIEKITSIDLEKDVKRKGKRKAEENVKIKLIVPLLEKLGYDTVKDLDFEHRVRTKKADIAIELDGKPRVSIECKDVSEDLDAHLPQAFQYACWKGFLLLVLTNGSEIRVYKTWEASSELEDRLLFSSKLEELPKTFFEKKGLWDYLSKPNVMLQSEVIDKWKESGDKLPMLTSYINGLLDDVCMKPDKQKVLREAFQHLAEYRHSAAIESFRKCLALDISDSEKLALHIQIGNCFCSQGKLIEALGTYQEGLDKAKRLDDRLGMATSLGNIGVVHSKKGEHDVAVGCHNEALAIHRETKYRKGEADTLSNIGTAYFERRDTDTALKYLQEALEISREIGYKQGEAIAIGNMGLVYKAQNELDHALKCHEQAAEIFREVGDRQGEANNLGSIGDVYHAKNDPDTALNYHHEALHIHVEIGAKLGEAKDLGNIGLIHKDKNDLDNALKYLTDALDIFSDIGTPQFVVQTLLNSAPVYLKKQDFEKAFESLAQALSLSASTGQLNEAFEALLVVITAMVADNKWRNLTKIDVMYRSGIITDKSFVNFFTCIHELALFHETGELKHKMAYKNAWQELNPRLRSILTAIIREEEEEAVGE